MPRRHRRLGLRSRVTAAFALGALVLSVSLSTLTYFTARQYFLHERQTAVLRQADRSLRSLAPTLAAGSVAITSAGVCSGRWASGRALRPLGDVAHAAVAIAGGRLDTRLETFDEADLATLASSFNRMADRLQERIEREARFTSDVSHELRSPLTTLSTAIGVLEARRDDLPQRSRRALDLLAAELRRFQRMVSDLLEISRFDTGSAELSLDDVRGDEPVQHAARGGGGEGPRSRADAAPAAAAVLVVGSLVACGGTADSQPRALASKDIPCDLLAPSTTVATPGTPGARASISVYLVGITGLVPVSREVREPATLPEALNSLLAGPTDAEVTNGLRTAISAQTSVSAGPVGFGVGTVDLGGAFGEVGGQDEILSVARHVFTATSVPGIVKVQFTLAGRPVEVPAGDGTLTQGPLGRSDFPSLGG